MITNQFFYMTIIALVANFSLLSDVCARGVNANSRGVSTSCVLVKSGIPRSKIIVKGTGLKGEFYARAYSLSEERWIDSKATKLTDKRGMVKFVFDSDPEAVELGATRITPDFNREGEAGGSLRESVTNARIASMGAECKIK
jgi:hypothetical protein